MKGEFRTLKIRLTKELSPFIEMLTQRTDLSDTERYSMAETIEARVISNPEQYLGKDVPDIELTKVIVREIFEEFIPEYVPKAEASV